MPTETKPATITNPKDWETSIKTLQSMCLSQRMGDKLTPETFVSNLRLFADCMEKLIE